MGRPIGQWDATAGWAGPYTNGANDRPIEQWAQPIHQSVSSIIISYQNYVIIMVSTRQVGV